MTFFNKIKLKFQAYNAKVNWFVFCFVFCFTIGKYLLAFFIEDKTFWNFLIFFRRMVGHKWFFLFNKIVSFSRMMYLFENFKGLWAELPIMVSGKLLVLII
jgi:hypothetical protein